MNCPQCGKPIETQQHRAAQSRWSQMSKSERSAEMSQIRRKGIKKPKRVARRSNELFQESFGFRPNGPNKNDVRKHGIYVKDLNGDCLDRLTPELLNRLEISLQIEAIS